MFGLHLFYSCMNQAMVQRGFGARSEWDVRIAVLFVGFFLFFRPFIEIFPGMIARALAMTGHSEFLLGDRSIDDVFPMIIKGLVPAGFQGLVLVGILSSVMSTIAALLNSISTLITLDVYKKWVRKDATDTELVKVGTIATLVLMIFSVVYAPMIEHLGGIFIYFQAAATYLAVPVATVFLFGIFWKRSTPAAAFVVLSGGHSLRSARRNIVRGHPTGRDLTLDKQLPADRAAIDNRPIQLGQFLCRIGNQTKPYAALSWSWSVYAPVLETSRKSVH